MASWRRPPDANWQKLVAVNARSGDATGSWRYDTFAGGNLFTTSPDRVFIDAGRLYLVRPDGGAVAHFPVGASGASARVTQPMFGPGSYVVGPVNGLVLFETPAHQVVGARTAGRSGLMDVTLLGPGAPLSRRDSHDDVHYAGRTDGTFWAVDLATARPLYFVDTGGSGFGPTLVGDGSVVLQTSSHSLVLDRSSTEASTPTPGAGRRVVLGRKRA